MNIQFLWQPNKAGIEADQTSFMRAFLDHLRQRAMGRLGANESKLGNSNIICQKLKGRWFISN